uniref:Uncharacterized protein n=1 Tax=Kalanchoe fedtschenkoi TaxID=63787 RepID=A0A7N0TY06_KALFE
MLRARVCEATKHHIRVQVTLTAANITRYYVLHCVPMSARHLLLLCVLRCGLIVLLLHERESAPVSCYISNLDLSLHRLTRRPCSSFPFSVSPVSLWQRTIYFPAPALPRISPMALSRRKHQHAERPTRTAAASPSRLVSSRSPEYPPQLG